MEIRGRVAVVTGAASGIGRALCLALARHGAAGVVAADLDPAGAQAVADQLHGLAVRTDVAAEDDVADLVRRATIRFGRIDIYCSNAGVARRGGPEAPDAAWEESFRVHLMAHVYTARHVLPQMLARGDGYLLGTVSAAGLLNHVLASPYAASKAAGLSFLEWLSIAYGDRGIRVSALCPQGVRTPMLEGAAGGEFLLEEALSAEAVAEAAVAGVADERFLLLPHPEVARYFAQKASDYDRWLRGMRRLRASLGG